MEVMEEKEERNEMKKRREERKKSNEKKQKKVTHIRRVWKEEKIMERMKGRKNE